MINKNNSKINYGYKLFEQNPNGDLFPLFIDKNTPVPVGEWVKAEFHPTKGFAARGGWHLGTDIPDAPWLKAYDGTDTGFYKPRWKRGKRVWCLVEYNANHDYNSEVNKLKKKCFEDKVPEDGFYFFREAGKGTWIITSDIRVVKVVTDEERSDIIRKKHYDEAEAFAKYKTTFEKRARN